MFLDDLLHDGQAKAGAFAAGCHVRFKQPCAVFGQADAVVGDGDRDAACSFGCIVITILWLKICRARLFPSGFQWLRLRS